MADGPPGLLRSPSRRKLIAYDWLAGTGYAITLLALQGATSWLDVFFAAGIGLPVAARRRWPLPVFAVVLGMSVLSLVLDSVREPFGAAAFTLYVVALTRPNSVRRLAPGAIGIASAGLLVGAAVAGMPHLPAERVGMVLLGLALLGGAWTVGRAVRERRAYAAQAAEQLAHRAVTDERLRIARELHDIVAHSMSLIAVKSGIANHVAETHPAEARIALEVIERTSRSSLAEMRHLLGVLRTEPEAASLDPPLHPPLHPPPGLSGLSELVDRAAMAGVQVQLDVDDLDGVPAGLELSIYRIVQEAVTNVVKHAAPARCRVRISVESDDVRIEVADDGPGVRMLPDALAPPPDTALPDNLGPTQGHGIAGMRERVMMYGGTLAAGPGPKGGFVVHARLPHETIEETSR